MSLVEAVDLQLGLFIFGDVGSAASVSIDVIALALVAVVGVIVARFGFCLRR